MSFAIKQPKKKDIKPILSLVFIDSAHFLNNSLGNLVKNLGENYFYHVSWDFNINVLDLVKEKGFYPIGTGIILKNSEKVYLEKIHFVIHWLIVQLVLKTTNMLLMFGKLLR